MASTCVQGFVLSKTRNYCGTWKECLPEYSCWILSSFMRTGKLFLIERKVATSFLLPNLKSQELVLKLWNKAKLSIKCRPSCKQKERLDLSINFTFWLLSEVKWWLYSTMLGKWRNNGLCLMLMQIFFALLSRFTTRISQNRPQLLVVRPLRCETFHNPTRCLHKQSQEQAIVLLYFEN